MHPDNHVLHTFLSYNLSFPESSKAVTSLIMPTNDGPVLIDFAFGRRKQFQKLPLTSDVTCSEIITPQSALLSTTLYSIVVIDIENCLDTYHLIL